MFDHDETNRTPADLTSPYDHPTPEVETADSSFKVLKGNLEGFIEEAEKGSKPNLAEFARNHLKAAEVTNKCAQLDPDCGEDERLNLVNYMRNETARALMIATLTVSIKGDEVFGKSVVPAKERTPELSEVTPEYMEAQKARLRACFGRPPTMPIQHSITMVTDPGCQFRSGPLNTEAAWALRRTMMAGGSATRYGRESLSSYRHARSTRSAATVHACRTGRP